MVWGMEEPDYPKISRIAALNLTDESHGNVIGIGLADIITRKIYEKIDFDVYYTNILTSTMIDRGKIPIIAENDEVAIKWALKTCWAEDKKNVRVARIKNTLMLNEISISRAIFEQERENDKIEPTGDFFKLEFDNKGMLCN